MGPLGLVVGALLIVSSAGLLNLGFSIFSSPSEVMSPSRGTFDSHKFLTDLGAATARPEVESELEAAVAAGRMAAFHSEAARRAAVAWQTTIGYKSETVDATKAESPMDDSPQQMRRRKRHSSPDRAHHRTESGVVAIDTAAVTTAAIPPCEQSNCNTTPHYKPQWKTGKADIMANGTSHAAVPSTPPHVPLFYVRSQNRGSSIGALFEQFSASALTEAVVLRERSIHLQGAGEFQSVAWKSAILERLHWWIHAASGGDPVATAAAAAPADDSTASGGGGGSGGGRAHATRVGDSITAAQVEDRAQRWEIAICSDLDVHFYRGWLDPVVRCLDDADLCFMKGGKSFVNGGFFAMRCTSSTHRFWRTVVERTLALRPGEKGAAMLEQTVINRMIQRNDTEDVRVAFYSKALVRGARATAPCLRQMRVHHCAGCGNGKKKLATLRDVARYHEKALQRAEDDEECTRTQHTATRYLPAAAFYEDGRRLRPPWGGVI